MSSMGNLEKLGILVIVILVVVVGVVAITPTDNAPDVLGADVARPAGEVAPLDPVAGDVTNGAFPADGTGAAPGGAPADWPVVPGTAGTKKDTTSADLGASGAAPGGVVDPVAPPSVIPAPTTYKEVKVGKNETLAIIAKRELGSSTRWPEIVALNPGLDPKRMKTGVTIKVPLKDGVAASAPVTPPTGQTPVAQVPGGSPAPVVDNSLPPSPKADTPAPVAEKTYTVQSGDTLSDIARRQLGSASKVGELKAANADVLKGSDVIRSGMKLRIPGTSSTTTASAPRTTTTAPAVEVSAAGGSTYTVQSGDTLSSIASRFLGSSSRYKEIIAANEPVLHGSDKLKVGMKLSIPSNVSAK